MENLKKTPLFDSHRAKGAKLVPFGGWNMPVSFEGVLAEHHHVRTKAGVFDVSHMGEIFVSGPDAKAYLRYILMNDVERLQIGTGQYSALINPQGGIVDDLIVYRLEEMQYLCCVNASNIDKDFEWMQTQKKDFHVALLNASTSWGQIALQGPLSQNIALELLKDSKFLEIPYMGVFWLNFRNHRILAARTGYTGELGFEFYCEGDEGTFELWNHLLSHSDVKPIGLGARDTLRLEACYVLYGNDIDDQTSPFEGAISWALKLDKDMVAREILTEEKKNGAKRKLVAFKMVDEGIARSGMNIFTKSGESLGRVTSGSVLPTVGGAGGLALVTASASQTGTEIFVDIRGQKRAAQIVTKPLYQAKTKN